MASSLSPGSVTATTRQPRALVVRDPRPEEIGARVDWSAWYLTDEDDMGEGTEQTQIIDLLKSALREHARRCGWAPVLISGDQFFAWVPEQPQVRVSPHVYILDDPPAPPWPRVWETWEVNSLRRSL